MIKTVTIYNQHKLVESQVNGRAIAIYYNLYPIAFENGDDGFIYDFNIHKLLRVLKSRGINSTHRQVNKSIKELLNAGLISFVEKNLVITEATLKEYATFRDNKLSGKEQVNKINETGEEAKFVPHIYLNDILLSNDFYKLNVRAKRLLLYILNNFNKNPKDLINGKQVANINVRNRDTKKYFAKFMHLNNETKIKDTINDLKPFFFSHVWQKNKNQRNRTYNFKMTTEFKDSYKRKLVTYKHLLLFNPSLRKYINKVLNKNTSPIKTTDRMDLVHSFLFIEAKNITKIIDDVFTYKTNTIKHIKGFFTKAINQYYYYQKLNSDRDYIDSLKTL